MVIEACYCNWGIPGVDKLPAHNHTYLQGLTEPGSVIPNGPFKGQRYERMVSDPDRINIWVDWKAVARSLDEQVTA